MAAHIRVARKLLHNSIYSSNVLLKRNHYIVLLPEVPKDTPEDNPLLRIKELPEFSKITSTNYYNGITKTLLEYEAGLKRLEDKCHDSSFEISFENLIQPLEELLTPFDNAWITLKNQVSVQHSEPCAKIFWDFQPHVLQSRSTRYLSKPLYHAFKELNADRNQLTEVQKRIVDKYLLEGELNGIELSGNNLTHLKKVLVLLENETKIFRKKVKVATHEFKHPIKDPSVVRDFPPELFHALAENKLQPAKGPWIVQLRDDIYDSFMKYCPDRELRWNTWHARIKRCSLDVPDFTNSVHLDEIRHLRQSKANLLGYNNFAEMSMKTKMAQNLDNVNSMIASILVKAKPAMQKELAELNEFAQESGFDHELEEYDVPYWRRKQKLSTFMIDADEVRPYFPLEKVLCGLFELCDELFGVKIQESDNSVDKWNDQIRFYEIYENGVHRGSFYFDMYARPNEKLSGCWFEAARNRCDSAGMKPIGYLVTNFCPPLTNQPTLLSFEEVTNLFKQFGNTLQHVLTDVPYFEISGLANVEWDALNVCSHFLSNWLDDYSVIKNISCHFVDKVHLPKELFDKIRGEQLHMKAYDLMNELYLSDLDINLHSRKDHWLDVVKDLWPKYHDYNIDKDDNHPCALPVIISDEFPAAYFSLLWSEMIAADINEAFKECNSPHSKKELGKRFRDSFLALGGGCHSSEVFRMFRGRDPSPEAFLKRYKLSKTTDSQDNS